MSNKPDQAKRDVRAFERWFLDTSPGWPEGLFYKGGRALLALKTLDQADVPEPIVREAAKDLADFNTAYAAFIASNRREI